MKRRIFTLIALLWFTVSYAQQETISGVVKSAGDQAPIPGANVLVKNSQQGTVTDIEGKFSLLARQGDVLTVSFVGMRTQEITLNGQSSLEILLEVDLQQLEEVIVVGYGTQRKSDVTGSISGISGTELLKQPALTPTQAMQGKLTGVQIVNSGGPGENPMVRVRGVGTILGGADPLYVVDGIITNDIRNINTSDIVSIDVLKDASSASIYGVRGANGVILITTKAGQKGKMNINYDGFIGVKTIASKVDMADSRLFIDYANEALSYDNQPPAFDDADAQVNTDWLDAVTRTALTQSHNLSVKGGNDKATYYASLGYYGEEGILKNNDYERINFRLNNTFQLTKNIKLGNVLGLSHFVGNNIPFSVFTAAYKAAPTVPVKDAEGNYGFTSQNNVGNPVATIDHTHDRSWGDRMQGSLFAEVTFLKDFQFRTSFGLDAIRNKGRIYVPVYRISDTQKNEISVLTLKRNNYNNWVWDNTLTYSKNFGNRHSLKVMAGTTAQSNKNDEFEASRQNVPAQERYWNLSLGDEASATNNSKTFENKINSYIGRLNYSFADRYLLTVTARYDGSSKFPKNNRWVLFPSVGLGWRLSEEPFMQDIDWLDNLKVRGSWGKIGNDNIDSDAFLLTFVSGLDYAFAGGSTLQQGATIVDIKDLNLLWETTYETDLGVEFSMFNGRITGEIDYYHKRTKDVLMPAPLDAIFGDRDNSFITNKADILNEGLEFALNWRQSAPSGFNYSVGVNLTYNKNKLEDIKGATPIISGSLGNGQVTTRTDVGQPIGSFWLWETDGIFQSQDEINAYVNEEGGLIQPDAKPGDFRLKDINKDGIIDVADRSFSGSYQPEFYFGFVGSISYKNFDLSIDTYGNLGNKVYNGKKAQRFGNENIEADLAGRWNTTTPSNSIPRASNDVPLATTYFLESGDFFRINNITLGYTMPASLSEKIHVGNLRVYASAQNPVIFKDFSGFTPELPGDTRNAGIELNAYPTSSTYLLGLNIGF
ncbi:TonB-dependent receptor [Rapidithrix thailandica]|uniref:TonB-dependent receptor n=1 Tax=Rapidithrix thailandica TaxID=413964 RepID=A0AAW9S1B7_9BACT